MRIKLLAYISIFWLLSCTPVQKKEEKNPDENLKITSNYQSSEFNNKERVSSIIDVLKDKEEIFVKHAKAYNMPGMVYGVVVEDSLVFSGGTGYINIETKKSASINSLFRIASMSKSFTAMAILILRDEGKLSLDDPASNYLKELNSFTYPTEDSSPITIHHLLTMTAGFPEDNPWGDRQLDTEYEHFLEFLKGDISFSNTPSFQYEYSNLGYAILGAIISEVSGEPYQKFIKERIFHPLGMKNTYWEYMEVPDSLFALGYRWEDDQWKKEPILNDGAYGSMGGIITSITDFSKYVSFHLSAWPPRNGKDNGILKRSSLREMQTMKVLNGVFDLESDSGLCAAASGYGYGLGILKDCQGVVRVAHGGALPGYGSYYQFYPEYGIGLMAFCNLTYTPTAPALNEIKDRLFKNGITPRELPPSAILKKRKEEVFHLITTWDKNLEKEILAMNFYLDKSREKRMEEANNFFNDAGQIISVEEIRPLNQLRGTFLIKCEKKILSVFFTLTPEKDPKVQKITIREE
ncbi:MAG: beta-lactamase family protein [Cyclobacteriaceae bacterium]|nr:beta-lactamase family protein [Cyclobacteriaceae bacterium]